MGRHLDLVYATALRRLGDPQAAEDVAQGAFCLLARKASTLNPAVSVVGWLYQTAFFMASKHQESERRRRCRELEAAQLSLQQDPEHARWEQIAPVLDEAMNRLSDPERNLLLLRFFKGALLHEVGKSLGVSEDAARMRVNRSLDKLRELLQQHGIASTTAALAAILTQQAVQAAPVQASQAIQTAVIKALAAAGGPTFLATLRTTMKQITLKTALLAGSALMVGFIATLHVYNRLQTPPAADETARKPLVLSPARNVASSRPPLTRVGGRTPAMARNADADATEPPAQVNLEAKFVELTETAARSIPLFPSDSYRVNVLTREQFRELVNQLEQSVGVDVMSLPNVTTLSGRQAQISATVSRPMLVARSHTETRTHPFDSPVVSEITYVPTGENSEVITNLITTGPTLDVIPFVQDTDTIQLTCVPSITQFLGYHDPAGPAAREAANGPASAALGLVLLPRLCVMQSTNNVTVGNGQTALCGPFYHEVITRFIDDDKSGDFDPADESQTNAAAGQTFRAGPTRREVVEKKAIYVFVTARMVDPAGNLVGSAKEGTTGNPGSDTAEP